MSQKRELEQTEDNFLDLDNSIALPDGGYSLAMAEHQNQQQQPNTSNAGAGGPLDDSLSYAFQGGYKTSVVQSNTNSQDRQNEQSQPQGQLVVAETCPSSGAVSPAQQVPSSIDAAFFNLGGKPIPRGLPTMIDRSLVVHKDRQQQQDNTSQNRGGGGSSFNASQRSNTPCPPSVMYNEGGGSMGATNIDTPAPPSEIFNRSPIDENDQTEVADEFDQGAYHNGSGVALRRRSHDQGEYPQPQHQSERRDRSHPSHSETRRSPTVERVAQHSSQGRNQQQEQRTDQWDNQRRPDFQHQEENHSNNHSVGHQSQHHSQRSAHNSVASSRGGDGRGRQNQYQGRDGQEDISVEDDYMPPSHPGSQRRPRNELRSTGAGPSSSPVYNGQNNQQRDFHSEQRQQQRQQPRAGPSEEEWKAHLAHEVKVAALQSNIDCLQADLEGQTNQVAHLEDENADLRNKVHSGEKLNGQQQNEIKSLKAKIKEMDAEHQSILCGKEEEHADQVNQLHTEQEHLAKDVAEEHKQQVTQMDKELQQLGRKNNHLEAEFARIDQQNKTLKERLENLTKKLDNVQCQNRDKNDDLHDLESKNNQLSKELQRVIATAESLEDQAAIDKENLQMLENELRQMVDRKEEYKHQLANVQQEKDEQMHKMRELWEEKDNVLQSTEKQLADLEQSIKREWGIMEQKKHDDFVAAKAKLEDEHKEMLKDAMDSYQDLQKDRDELASRLAGLTHKEEATRRSFEARDHSVQELNSQLNRLQAELGEVRQRSDRMEQQYKDQLILEQDTHTDTVSSKDRIIYELEAQLKRLQEMNQTREVDTQNQAASNRTQVERTKTEMFQAERRAANFEKKYVEATKQVEEGKTEQRRLADETHNTNRSMKYLQEAKEKVDAKCTSLQQQLERMTGQYNTVTNALEDMREEKRSLEIRGGANVTTACPSGFGGGGGGVARISTPLLRNATNTNTPTKGTVKTPSSGTAAAGVNFETAAQSPLQRVLSGINNVPASSRKSGPISSPSGHEETRPSQRRRFEGKCFAFSGYPAHVKEELITTLRTAFPSAIIDDSIDGMIRPKVTHLITEATDATVKLWSARLGGCWILNQRYIEACQDAGAKAGGSPPTWPDESMFGQDQVHYNPLVEEKIAYTSAFEMKTACFTHMGQLAQHFGVKLVPYVDGMKCNRVLYHKSDLRSKQAASDRFGTSVDQTSTWNEFRKKFLY